MQLGVPDIVNYKVELDGRLVKMSPLRHITLFNGPHLQYICVTPRGSNKSYHYQFDQKFPYLSLSRRNGKLWRYTKHAPRSVGYLPQTWFTPSSLREGNEETRFGGRPLQVIEISETFAKFGEVRQVKPLSLISVSHGEDLSYYLVCVNVNEYLTGCLEGNRLSQELDDIKSWIDQCFNNEDAQEIQIVIEEYSAPNEFIDRVLSESHSLWNKTVDGQSDKEINYGQAVWANYSLLRSKSYDLSAKINFNLNEIPHSSWELNDDSSLSEPKKSKYHINLTSPRSIIGAFNGVIENTQTNKSKNWVSLPNLNSKSHSSDQDTSLSNSAKGSKLQRSDSKINYFDDDYDEVSSYREQSNPERLSPEFLPKSKNLKFFKSLLSKYKSKQKTDCT